MSFYSIYTPSEFMVSVLIVFECKAEVRYKTLKTHWFSVLQEKGGAFSGIFKKSSKPADVPAADEVRGAVHTVTQSFILKH